jgi:two-component system, LytTR family, response regulator
MITALLVDDEQNNIDNLKFMLENDCADVKVMGTAANGTQARAWLSTNKVDVVFLDISMPGESGIQMLELMPDRDFSIVFVTAHNEYAIQAIKASAIDYLLKPVNITELQNAVVKLQNASRSEGYLAQSQLLVNQLIKSMHHNAVPTKIALPQLGSTTFLDIDEIVSIQADSNYSIIHKQDMQKLVVTKILKDFEEILDPNQFIRIHKSHIINLGFIKEYSTVDGGVIKMKDGNVWPVSRRQTELLLQKMKENAVLFFK